MPEEVVDVVNGNASWLTVPAMLSRGLGNPRESDGDWYDFYARLSEAAVRGERGTDVPDGRGSEGGAAMGAAADGPPPSGGAREERVGGAPVEAGDARGASDEGPGAGSTERIIG